MKPLLILVAGLALLSGCETAALRERRARVNDAVPQYIGEMTRPLISICVGAGAFWVVEKRWPASMEELAALPGADGEWKAALSRFTAVAFDSQPDGSVTVSGTILPPSALGGIEVHAAPVTFSARVRMQPAPGTSSGWRPAIETDIANPDAPPGPPS